MDEAGSKLNLSIDAVEEENAKARLAQIYKEKEKL